MKVITNKDRIERVLTRGVDTILPTKEGLAELLSSGKRIRLYQGFDPTGTQLHIGHMVGLRKLAQFQKLGHEVIFLIGDGTGLAGDPSGKAKSRDKFFSHKELRENAVDYVKQAGRVVDFEGDNPALIKFNGDWLNKLPVSEFLQIAGHFSLQQLSERDMFQERIKKGETVNLREFLYPLLQGYDSVVMDVDLEIGATEQMFNMLAGRTLVKAMLDKEKFVLTTPLLTDSKGRKIGKSEGNVIAIAGSGKELFGGIMSLPDSVINQSFELLTDILPAQIPTDPFEAKKKLALEIIKILKGAEEASMAMDEWVNIFSKGETPGNILEVKVKIGELLVDVLLQHKLIESRSEFRRLVEEGAVSLDGAKIINHNTQTKDGILRVGKHRFLKIISN
ncbi:MAG TPA: tyrosine--tRNA ligase [Candidatus Paceibacterota bacterium]